jgi:hypothetical protein
MPANCSPTTARGIGIRGPSRPRRRSIGALARLITDRDSAGAETMMQRHVQFDQVTAMDLLAALS